MLSRVRVGEVEWTGREGNQVMRTNWTLAGASCLIVALAAIAPGASAEKDEKGFVRLTPDQIEWKARSASASRSPCSDERAQRRQTSARRSVCRYTERFALSGCLNRTSWLYFKLPVRTGGH
jgi:hypothetical protein